MKTHLLWDHDGVLVDTEPLYYEATRQCIAALGITLGLDEYLIDMVDGTPAWDKARAIGVAEEDVIAAREARDNLYQRLLQQESIEIPGVVDILQELAKSYQMAIVTTAKRTDFELIHRQRHPQRQIVANMQFVLASGDYARAKPHPDPYLTALARFTVEPAQALVIEDSERGLRAAVAAGIDCVVVDNAFTRGQNFSAAQHRIKSLAELPALLTSI